MIICCKCGVSIEPRLMNMCDRCISTEIDITASIKTNDIIQHCRQCDRYFTPPKNWQSCPWGSRELLILLLKKNKTLSKFKILDSDFVYTEEHSKQIEITVTVQKDNIIKQTNIKYKIRNFQCSACQKIEAKQYWTSIVQVRQHVPHKRTLLYLEQVILKFAAYNETSNIKERKDGIDFYYQNKTPALKMVNFIKSRFLCKLVTSERLITEDKKSNTSKYKFSYSIKLSPICKDDVVKVSDRVAEKYGINPVNIVLKVNSSIKMIDPITNKISEIDSRNYWGYKDEFKILASSKALRKFRVNEVIDKKMSDSKYKHLTDLFVSRRDNQNQHCKTYISNIKEGDSILGYDFLDTCVSEEVDFKVFLIRKDIPSEKNRIKIKTKQKKDREYDLFLEDLLQDQDINDDINLYDENENIINDLNKIKL